MLSILIPVYNFNITQLVNTLHCQATACAIPFEIVLIDDASEPDFKTVNKQVAHLTGVTYLEEPQNIGRSKIRNKLADLANYPYLIYMDCDSYVPSVTYIKEYIEHCTSDKVVCGGRIYASTPPAESKLILRWKYGRVREEVPADERNRVPNRSFMTNNFLISKNLFHQIRFHEGINGYGHEDTLFGYELKISNIDVEHINNPLVHVGLEDGPLFLDKTRESIRNLKFILGQNGYEKVLVHDIKLLAWYKFFDKAWLKKPTAFFFHLFENLLTQSLTGKKPNLYLFDIYKLGYMCSLK